MSVATGGGRGERVGKGLGAYISAAVAACRRAPRELCVPFYMALSALLQGPLI